MPISNAFKFANNILTNGGYDAADLVGAAGGGLSWQTIVTGATLTAVAGRGYWINTTSNACTVTLPASATAGDTIILVDYARNWGTNAVTINQNSLNFQGYSSPNPIYNTSGQSVTLIYSGATKGWIPTVDDDVTDEVPQTYSVDFLVIAGGGGGGSYGGGGAGGYRNSYSTESSGGGGSSEASLTFNPGTVYTVTVGAGGAGGGNLGTNGSNSSISGTGLSTITSTGGGGGSALATAGSGGSGGGSADSARGGAVGSGTANQGYAGALGSSDNSVYTLGGGGGGASSAGVAATSGGAGNGGNGLSSSITGSSVARGGGGGGGGSADKTQGTGSSGGGSGEIASGATGSAGTANTGGGGGGRETGNGYSGGSGVVILRMPDANYSGTFTGSPTVITGVGGTHTVITFEESGSYTG